MIPVQGARAAPAAPAGPGVQGYGVQGYGVRGYGVRGYLAQALWQLAPGGPNVGAFRLLFRALFALYGVRSGLVEGDEDFLDPEGWVRSPDPAAALDAVWRRLLASVGGGLPPETLAGRLPDRPVASAARSAALGEVLALLDRRVVGPILAGPAGAKDLAPLATAGLYEALLTQTWRRRQKANGTFYTPPEVVRYIVTRALQARGALKGQEGRGGRNGHNTGAGPTAGSALRVLDPAAGAGAFVLEAARALQGQTGRPLEALLGRWVVGWDRDPLAVDLSRVALALACAQTDRGDGGRPPAADLAAALQCRDALEGAEGPEEGAGAGRGSWDVVIGNPPYGQHGAPGARRAGGGYRDLYVAFIERGLELLRPGGILAFIVPVSWQTGERYRPFRQRLLEQAELVEVLNLPYDVFRSAYIDAGVVLLRRREDGREADRGGRTYAAYTYPKRARAERLLEEAPSRLEEVSASLVTKDPGLRVYTSETAYRLQERVWSPGPSGHPPVALGEVTESAIGVLVSRHPVSAGSPGGAPDDGALLWQPLFTGQVYPYRLEPGARSQPLWIGVGRNTQAAVLSTGPRILVRRIVSRRMRLMAAYAGGPFAVKKDLYTFRLTPQASEAFSPLFLLALLNSRLFAVLYLLRSSVAARDDFGQVTLTGLRELPVPRVGASQRAKIEELVRRAMAQAAAASGPGATGSTELASLREAIDEQVEECFGLTPQERVWVPRTLPSLSGRNPVPSSRSG